MPKPKKRLSQMSDEELARYLRKLNRKVNLAMLEIHRRKTQAVEAKNILRNSGVAVNDLTELRMRFFERSHEGN